MIIHHVCELIKLEQILIPVMLRLYYYIIIILC